MTEISQLGNSCSTENQGCQFQELTTEVRDTSADIFVNHGESVWKETREKWVGDKDKLHGRRRRVPEDPVISWSTTYEELLWTGNVFNKAIPLSEMVDFLVDIWHDEDLCD